ncbi:MAG TPA: saccharopine dehydrogenase NADP-binding domain-containing protein, partial [Blastocatellia bacterium]|nr:saccharopine dehydrogenase NADP-binding domain-containing protein [Blastocatellia bacterium]
MSKRPVVIYGANGFSGRLVAEFLREYNVPFIAAGRSRERLKDVMDHVPGIETADYEIAEVAGSVSELAELFRGAKVVCNTVGPFLYNGPRVLEACYEAGCHYLDIGGEQAWLRQVHEEWSEKFASRGLLAAPATA